MRKHTIKRLLLPLFMAVLLAFLPVDSLAAEDPAGPQDSDMESSAPVEEAPQPTEEPEPGPSAEPNEDSVLSSEPEEDLTQSPEPSLGPSQEPSTEPDEPVNEEDAPQTVFTKALASLKTGGHSAYMSGYAGGLFKPDQTMSRAEVAKTIYNLLTEKPAATGTVFQDLSSSHWAYKAVDALNSLGVMTANSKKIFRPDDDITRAEFVTILSRCFELETGTVRFQDVPDNHWAYKAISAVQAVGWVGGYPDGTFQPSGKIKRCEVVKILNSALGRRGEGFAADADKQEFKDVPPSHWAFKEIAEAANPLPEPSVSPTPTTEPTSGPTDAPTQAPGGITVGCTVKVNAETGLNIRQAPVDGAVITAVPNGTLLTVTDISRYPWLGVKTSGGITGYASGDYLTLYNGGGNNGGTPQEGSLSASSLTVRQYKSVRLDASADSDVSEMKWSSSNSAVAKVGYTIDYSSKKQSAIVYAGSPGTAVLTYADGTGKTKATCTVTVTEPEPVRFAYAEGVMVEAGKDFDLIAITDNSRDEVRFDVAGGSSYTSSSYQTESHNSKNGLPVNHTRVFRRTVKLATPGTYTVRAYASQDGIYSSEAFTFTVQVKAKLDFNETSYETRQASGQGLMEIKKFEGTVYEVEDDRLVAGNPTVGCGLVISTNESFYNNMTDTEAYALLVNTANTGVYARAVENFRREHNMKMSQAQFDALLSFVYNCGTNVLNLNTYETPNILLNMVVPPSDLSPSKPYSGTIVVESTTMYSAASSDSSKVMSVTEGAVVRVSEVRVIRSSVKQEVWYKSAYNGQTGWIPSGYVKLNGNQKHDLTYADSTSFANELLQWHMAGGRVTPGLVYRRLAECKMFFFANYNEGNGSSKYHKNTYGFVYPDRCAYLDER